jgi:hypothetical protein
MRCGACGSIDIKNITEDYYECQTCNHSWEKENGESELFQLPLDVYLIQKEIVKNPFVSR